MTEWQPIESAPKDGTRILVYSCEWKRHLFGRAYWFQGVPGDGSGWIASVFLATPIDDSRGSMNPTHWMPMLIPPVHP